MHQNNLGAQLVQRTLFLRSHATKTETGYMLDPALPKSSPSLAGQLESALDFEHQGDRDGTSCFRRSPTRPAAYDEEIAFGL
jgi:hypothetical protein